jgi:hypothetical protein
MDSATYSLAPATKAIRDAAKYLVAAFGAIGAVLVSGLSLTALPAGAHPFLAAVGVGVAVLALALLIGLAVSVLTPKAITLGELARQEEAGIEPPVIGRLKADEGLFAGQGTDLRALHTKYVLTQKDRVEANEKYLRSPTEPNRTEMEAAGARAELVSEASGQVLEAAVLFQLEDRFSLRRRALMTLLALFVVAGAGIFAWASTAPPSDPSPHPRPELSTQRIWLEHLVATSGFRIERLEREAETASTPTTRTRVRRALIRQRRVQRRQERAVGQLMTAERDST